MSGWEVDNRRLVSAQVRAALEDGVSDGVEFWLEHANRTVPLEEGTLERSGTASAEGLRGVVAYDTPYAARQHEDTTLSHDSGRRAKWLELTGQEKGKAILAHIAGKAKRKLR